MRRFEFSDGASNKFWEIRREGGDLHIRWGRIGTQGQGQTRNFADAAKAAAALDKLVAEKTGKGYREMAVVAPAAATVPAATAAAVAAAVAAAARAAAVLPTAAPSCAAVTPATKPATHDPAVAAPDDSAAAIEQMDIVSNAPVSASPAVRSAPVSAQEAASVSVAQSMPAATAAPPSSRSAVPPWLAQGESVDFAAACRSLLGGNSYTPARQILPTRGFPQPLPVIDAPAAWLRLCQHLLQTLQPNEAGSDPALWPLLQETWARVEQSAMRGSDASDALLLAIAIALPPPDEGGDHGSVAALLIAERGLEEALALLLRAQEFQVGILSRWHGKPTRREKLFVGGQVDEPLDGLRRQAFGSEERLFRLYLAAADAACRQRCVARVGAAIATLSPARQAVVALVLDDACIAAATALRVAGPQAPPVLCWLRLSVRDPQALEAIEQSDRREDHLLHDTVALATLLRERGADLVPLLRANTHIEHCSEMLRHIGVPAAVDALARSAGMRKGNRVRLNQAAQRWPLAAILALAEWLASAPREAALAGPLLDQLLQKHPAAPALLHAWLSPAAQAVLERLRARQAGPAEVAGTDELPPVLAAPPWLRPRRTPAGVAGLAPLPLPPQEHWETQARARSLLAPQRLADRYMGGEVILQAVRDLGMESNRRGPDKPRDDVLRARAVAAVQAGDADTLIALWRELERLRPGADTCMWSTALSYLPDEVAIAFWNELAGEARSTRDAEFVAARYGLRALPGLRKILRAELAAHTGLALRYADTEIALLAARAHARLKTLRDFGRDWLLQYPQHAAAALIAPALGKPGEARDCAGSALRLLAANGHEALLLEAAARSGGGVSAGLRSVLAEDALDRFPAKRAALPVFWAPRGWRRPRLRSNGKPLPDAALDALGTMLAFPCGEELYAGIGQVAEACTRESLADFAWDVFNAWLAAGARSRDGWGMQVLGWFGNDDSARRLTPLIRAWPGEAAHGRAVNALDVLAAIGSDVALMLLNGIAQKVKFKGLQDKAREKIDAIAQARGLTPEELEDRLAPDLGLDEAGTLLLDFGPRQFRVGFDESLKPYVRDGAGKRLPDLPRPNSTDDASRAAAAVERFKALKKDVRTIARQQVMRLESAMRGRRRWTAEAFRQFLVGHPLLRHLVQRLVWGVYALEPDATQGGRLLRTLRVAEDGRFTDAQDEPLALVLEENQRLGLPHRLELPAADCSAFLQLFGDYELVQPFVQLGRDCHALSALEQQADELLRWRGKVVPASRVLGLCERGWQVGAPRDSGFICWFIKPLEQDVVIELRLDPGIIAGVPGEFPEQTLCGIRAGKIGPWDDVMYAAPLGALDPIAASELIRDMEYLAHG